MSTATLLSSFPQLSFCRGIRQPMVLVLQVLLESLDTALAADAAVLLPAEGRVGAVEHAAVHAQRTRANTARDVHARAIDRDMTAPASPYALSLAIRTASSSSSNGRTMSTGPKTSSCAIAELLSTPTITVGAT